MAFIGKEYYRSFLLKRLSKFIKKGDVISAEFDLSKYGKLVHFFKEKEKFALFFINIILKLIGDKGILIIPTFTYSWGKDKKKKVFNIKKTIPNLGIIPKTILPLKNVNRTNDPMFSFAVLGSKKKREYFCKTSNNSFGKNSVYEKVLINKGKLLSFGLSQFDPTFVHYVEQYFHENFKKLNYRYMKTFSGYFVDKRKKKFFRKHKSFVRKIDSNYLYSEKKIKRKLKKEKKLKVINFLKTKIYICNSQDFFKYGFESLKKDKYFFVN